MPTGPETGAVSGPMVRLRMEVVVHCEGLLVANLVANPGIQGDSRGPEFPGHQQVTELPGPGDESLPFHQILSVRRQSFSYLQLTPAARFAARISRASGS